MYSDTKDHFYESLEYAVEDLEKGETLNDLLLLICEPQYAEIEEENFTDILPEDDETPEWLEDAIDVFNETARSNGPLSWWPGKFALEFTEEDLEKYRNLCLGDDRC